jgi:hypothetical protein
MMDQPVSLGHEVVQLFRLPVEVIGIGIYMKSESPHLNSYEDLSAGGLDREIGGEADEAGQVEGDEDFGIGFSGGTDVHKVVNSPAAHTEIFGD